MEGEGQPNRLIPVLEGGGENMPNSGTGSYIRDTVYICIYIQFTYNIDMTDMS